MQSSFQLAQRVRFASLPISVASFAAVVDIVALGLDWRAADHPDRHRVDYGRCGT